MADYPLILTLSFDVVCGEFSAKVITNGRALMTPEDGEWWCHGVDPGGITAHGENPALAFAAYKRAFSGVLHDLAHEAGGFDRFKRAVQAFVADSDRSELDNWQSARDLIRAGTPVEDPFSALSRITDTVVATVNVERLDRISASTDDVRLAEALAA
jgi:predicted RNase H-like HicB family nuclease